MPSPKSVHKPITKSWQFEAIGTWWQIDIADSQHNATELRKLIEIRIDEFDKTYSRFRIDSLVTKMSKQVGTYELPEDSSLLMNFYEQMYQLTNGVVTPLIGQTLADAGYDAEYSLVSKPLHKPPLWDDVIELKERQLHIKQASLLDFGAAGKGYLVDIISNLLLGAEASEFCVDAGGDMYHFSKADTILEVGLEHPDNPEEVIGIVQLGNQAICGSAGNKRAWGNYHHILDPIKLKSPSHIKAVWTTADTTMLADGMSTCLFFIEPEIMQSSYKFEYLIVFNDLKYQKSKNFPGKLFSNDRQAR